MDIKALIKDIPRNTNISPSDITNILNYALARLVLVPVTETIEVGDWIINKIDERTLHLTERYTDSDMSRFLHDEFTKQKMLKTIDKL